MITLLVPVTDVMVRVIVPTKLQARISGVSVLKAQLPLMAVHHNTAAVPAPPVVFRIQVMEVALFVVNVPILISRASIIPLVLMIAVVVFVMVVVGLRLVAAAGPQPRNGAREPMDVPPLMHGATRELARTVAPSEVTSTSTDAMAVLVRAVRPAGVGGRPALAAILFALHTVVA